MKIANNSLLILFHLHLVLQPYMANVGLLCLSSWHPVPGLSVVKHTNEASVVNRPSNLGTGLAITGSVAKPLITDAYLKTISGFSGAIS